MGEGGTTRCGTIGAFGTCLCDWEFEVTSTPDLSAPIPFHTVGNCQNQLIRSPSTSGRTTLLTITRQEIPRNDRIGVVARAQVRASDSLSTSVMPRQE